MMAGSEKGENPGKKRRPRAALSIDVTKRVCGARNREVSIGLKECMDVTNGRRAMGSFKG